jgi:hypothetical protein
VKAATESGMAESTAQDRLAELVRLGILRKDTQRKDHEYHIVQQFNTICSRPIEPLDHVLDATVEVSPGELLSGVRNTSPEKDHENQADLLQS